MIGIILFVCVFVYSPVSVTSFNNRMTTYDDSVVRRVVFPLTSASYGDTPHLCLKDIFSDGHLVNQYTVLCDRSEKHTCHAYLAYSPSAEAIFLVFRGSSSTEQVAEEFFDTLFHWRVEFPLGGIVNPYFHRALMTMLNSSLENDLISTIQSNPGFTLWITGHSLGAALASLAAGHVAHKRYVPPDDITLVTFGQPRTGSYEFAKAMDETIPNIWRVTHKNDLVPNLIPYFYTHHNREVWYNNSMAPGAPFVICSQDDNSECTWSTVNQSWDEHSNYFNVDSYFAIKGCKEKI